MTIELYDNKKNTPDFRSIFLYIEPIF